MEKTLLESTLEVYLPKIGMILGNRVYAEDLDFQADIEDCVSPVKSTDPDQMKLLIHNVLSDKGFSDAQNDRGQQYFLLRTSSIFNGFGLTYSIEDNKHETGLDKKSAKELADKVIRNRDFGDGGDEAIQIYYNSNMVWKVGGTDQRYQQQLINEFYGTFKNFRFVISVDSNNRIFIDNLAEEDNYNGCQIIRPMLEEIEQKFKNKILNKDNIFLLIEFLKKIRDNNQ